MLKDCEKRLMLSEKENHETICNIVSLIVERKKSLKEYSLSLNFLFCFLDSNLKHLGHYFNDCTFIHESVLLLAYLCADTYASSPAKEDYRIIPFTYSISYQFFPLLEVKISLGALNNNFVGIELD